jgi:hypothetical protein
MKPNPSQPLSPGDEARPGTQRRLKPYATVAR